MTLLAAALIALAAWWALPPPADPRITAILGATRVRHRPDGGRSIVTWIAAGCAAVGAVVAMPNLMGVVLAIAALVVVPSGVRRLETSGDRRDREALSRQAAGVCDLLSATLASGASLIHALAAVEQAVTMPAAGLLRTVRASLELGADPESAWAPLAEDPSFGPVAAAVVRSGRTGAPLAAVLARVADDLRRERRVLVEVAARSAGVRAVLPLAACFLPAFLLLGVVPVVASLATDLLAP